MRPEWAWPPPASFRLAVAAVRVLADVVAVVGDRLDIGVGVGVELVPRLPLITRARNVVLEMRNHAGRR